MTVSAAGLVPTRSLRRPAVPRYDLPNAAPEPLRLVQRFVNTSDREHGREWLGSPAELSAWMEEHGLGAGRSHGTDVGKAIELREALRALLRANNRGPDPGEAVAVVNRIARDTVVVEAAPAGRAVLAPSGAGVDGALGRITATALTAMLDGTWLRLKVCRKCEWAFYDYSKNRSGSWCSMQLCGNRLKTRAYRKRRSRRP
jgi:predicted RNA-binding Zn ribbon-like protein